MKRKFMKIEGIPIALMFTFFSLLVSVATAEEIFKFDWEGDQVSVVETIKKKGHELVLSYSIRAIRVPNGFEIRKSDFYILSINGEGVPETNVENTLLSALITPDIKVDEKGELLEVIDMESYIEKIIALKPEMRQVFENEKVLEYLYAQALEPWCYWVCLWIDLNLKPGESRTNNEDLESSSGSIPQIEVFRNHGSFDDNKYVKLSVETQLGGEETTKKMLETGKELISELSIQISNKFSVTDINRSTTVTAVIETKTLKPKAVYAATRTSIVADGGKTVEANESREFKFYWDDY